MKPARFSTRVTAALNRSPICVGLDPDPNRLPAAFRGPNAVLDFNKAIVDATIDLAGAYKPNFAFYEALGVAGWTCLTATMDHIHAKAETVLTIADAKRGDIGNTAKMYAKAILTQMDFDAVTVNPWMGFDSVSPFLEDPNKGAFLLCLTSNPGSSDFQFHGSPKEPLFLHVAHQAARWNRHGNCGLVVGATKPEHMAVIRDAVPSMPFLVPGIGAQGGDLESAVRINTGDHGIRAFINVSRSVLYASNGPDFAEAARRSVSDLRRAIDQILGTDVGPPE